MKFKIARFTSYYWENGEDMLWVSMVTSAVLFEELVSLIIVIGKSGAGLCACKLGITDIAKWIEDAKIAEIKNTHDLFISNLHLYQSI